MTIPALRVLAATILIASAGAASAAAQQTRDAAAAAPPANVTVTGIVVSVGETPQPLRRAVVTVSGTGLSLNRSAITDDNGRFAIARLPAGTFTVVATKRGYVNGGYGVARPGRPPTPVALAAGATRDLTISLSRAAVMTGVIRDESGAPVPGLRVFAISARQPAAPDPMRGDAGVLTDDRGIYRLHGLTPGEFLVVATPTNAPEGNITRRSTAETDATLARLRDRAAAKAGAPPSAKTPPGTAQEWSLAPVFYPGTAAMSRAGRITLAAGEVRDGLDFAMSSVPVTTIEGTIVSSAGAVPASVDLSITPADTLRFFALATNSPALTKRPGADGAFAYSGITPGPYVIRARASPSAPAPVPLPLPVGGGGGGSSSVPPPPPPPPLPPSREGAVVASDMLYAAEAIEVTSGPIRGVALRLLPGAQVRGRVVFAATQAIAPADLSQVRVALQPPGRTGWSTIAGTVVGNTYEDLRSAPLRADGSFAIDAVAPGEYRVQVMLPAASADAWRARSAMSGGRDLLDAGLQITPGAELPGVDVTLTDQRSELSGALQGASGRPAPEYFVIALPADPALRVKGSRRIKSVRPSTDGQYRFADLPAGDYLLVALTDVEASDLERAEFLEQAAAAGIKVTVADGEKKVQDLRIVGGV